MKRVILFINTILGQRSTDIAKSINHFDGQCDYTPFSSKITVRTPLRVHKFPQPEATIKLFLTNIPSLWRAPCDDFTVKWRSAL